jgi:hypothetical protein
VRMRITENHSMSGGANAERYTQHYGDASAHD